MIKQYTCITCPMSCKIEVALDDKQNILKISNNRCIRGEKFVRQEIIEPKRMLTTTVKVIGSNEKLLPIISDRPIVKNKIIEAMKEINQLVISVPIEYKQVVIKNICGSDVNMLASKSLKS